MGSGISRTRSGRSRPQEQRPRPRLRRAISSLLVCGASSSSRELGLMEKMFRALCYAPIKVAAVYLQVICDLFCYMRSEWANAYLMEDYPAELLVNSAEHGHQEKFKFLRKKSDLSMGNGDDLVSSKSESLVSSRRWFAANGNSAPEDGGSNVERGNRGKFLSESRELIPSYQSTAHSRGIETASTSYVDQLSSDCVSLNEMSSTNAMNTINYNMNGALSQFGQRFNNTCNVYSHGLGGLLLDELSVENNVSEEADFSNSDFGSSFVSDSPMDTHLPRDDTIQEATPSHVGFLVSEREHNRQDVNLLQVDVVSISSNILPTNSAEINSREARRNSRRLFWDAFSRRSSRRHTESRTFGFSPGDSESLRSHDRWLLDFTGGFYNDEVGGDLRSHGSRTPSSHELQTPGRNEQQTPSSNGERTPGSNEQDTPGSNEHRWNSRFEVQYFFGFF
ncbi:UNVERIFIED_CONTAM: hypothetical protein Sangu_1560000 [Sesamum angustifolium]|uniref:Uncharacterized protein n=1 Tax=Sesamum angustifolium TaxID=2727405 RepID=A0AAW2MSW0_9LAMI